MEENAIHKILIVESSDDLKKRIEKILSACNGFELEFVSSAKDAFACLEESIAEPFALIISNYQMPRMKGDMILEKAKEYSPDTQRMLLADSSNTEIVINAINTAEIRCCLSLPFQDNELISQVKYACEQFDHIQKKIFLTKVTERQNRQMYRIARNFKNKEYVFKKTIKAKEKKIKRLKSKIAARIAKDAKKIPMTLEDFMELEGIPALPEEFVKGLMFLADQTKKIFNDSMTETELQLEDIDYASIIQDTETENKYTDLIESILPFIFELAHGNAVDFGKTYNSGKAYNNEEPQHKGKKIVPDDYLELIVSKDNLKALIRIKKPVDDIVTIDTIKEFLKINEIRFGLKDDVLIQAWLKNTKINDDPFVIAEGISPEFPEDAKIKYYFKTDFRKAGKILEDGSIDFRDRGDIPFISKDTLLAEKTNAVPGTSGINIFGESMPVGEPKDLAFECGTGARFSQDKLKIFADADGMPHMDALGKISVLSELSIKDDVDYTTGNLDFNGNIVVKGVVRSGFSVKCANLTVKEIEGADIDITGDLNVSAGIIDSDIILVQGNIQAKYVNNSRIKAFGDLTVQKEIIDSKILLSGACINETGSIISSYISAKKGITARDIGTKISSPSKLKVGLNEHIEVIMELTDEKIKKNTESVKTIKEEILQYENKNNDLNVKISELAFIQDRSETRLREINQQMQKLEASNNITALKKMIDKVSQLRRNIKLAEHKLNIAFSRQVILSEKILEKENKIHNYETENKKLVQYKKELKKRSDRDEPVAEVKVNKTIMPGTIIVGPNAAITIKEPASRCRIIELEVKEEEEGPVMYYKMDIASL